MLVMLTSSPGRRFTFRALAMVPVGAIIVHLIATFVAMADTRNSAYTRLNKQLPVNKMQLLDAITPAQQPLPFLSPDSRYSICRFDTKLGPVAVRAVLPDIGWTLGIYHPDGSSAYFATTAPGQPSTIVLSIVPSDNRFLGLTPQALGKAANADPQLIVSAIRGLIVVRAPDKGQVYRADAEAGLAQATCAQATY